MRDIEEFWILNFDGIVFFSYSPDSILNVNLIGAFFSAIQSFAKGMSNQEEINAISLGQYNFIFLSNESYNLYFVAKANKKVKVKDIQKNLKDIENMFIADFNDKLNNFDGEIDQFEDFKPKFTKYFNDNFMKLKNMW